jgi:hypothetical protein
MKSWKTTLVGFGAGFLNLYAGGFTVKTALLSAALAAFGLVAKDHNVTGGSVAQ